MELKKPSGLLGRLYVATISRVKTVRGNISECLSCRKIVRLLIPTMMSVLSLMSVGALLLGRPCLSSSAAVDYSKPIQKVSYRWAAFVAPSSMSTIQNNWREISYSRDVPIDSDYGSFRLSVNATNNYGTDFDVWCTILSASGGVCYDSGWKSSAINNDTIYMSPNINRINIIIRIRYNDESGYTNPPQNSEFTGVSWVINYDVYANYSDDNLPEGWAATTTAVNTDIPVTALTTTTYIDWDSQVSGNNGFFETIRYSVSTLFGIGDSWESAVYVMNYMNDRLPYVFAIGAFCGMVGIAVWFLEK